PLRISPRTSDWPPSTRRPYQPKAFAPERTMTGLPAKSLSVVPSMTIGPVMIGRPGDAGWISCDPVSWNAIVSRPGLALAALIASRRLQWLALHVPSLTSFGEFTVNVVGVGVATVVDSLTLLSPASGSGSFAVTDALVSA